MKKIILSLLILTSAFYIKSYSQDIIYKKDGSKEEAKITQVGAREIQYKKFSNLEGPVYSLAKSEIVMITYANGEHEIITPQYNAAVSNKQELSTNYARNLLGYHLFDVVYGDFTLSYERILSSGTIGIKIPLGFGYAYNTDYYTNSDNFVKNLVYSGIGVNFYPTGQGKWRYFLGPAVRFGYGKQSSWESIWDEYGNYIGEEEIADEGIYTKFIVDNGIMFTPVRNLSISSIVGVGIRFFPEASQYNDAVLPTAYFSTNLHFRF
jgi:hypothetical protein